jgi:hypothetical protein
MTRKQFDAATQENWGGRGMASDERDSYRWKRMRRELPQVAEHDYIALRAKVMARRNSQYSRLLDGRMPTLGRGTIFRAWAEARRGNNRSLLGPSILFH